MYVSGNLFGVNAPHHWNSLAELSRDDLLTHSYLWGFGQGTTDHPSVWAYGPCCSNHQQAGAPTRHRAAPSALCISKRMFIILSSLELPLQQHTVKYNTTYRQTYGEHTDCLSARD